MSALSRSSPLLRSRGSNALPLTTLRSSHASPNAATASYRRLSSIQQASLSYSSHSYPATTQHISLRHSPRSEYGIIPPTKRLLHTSPSLLAKVGKPRGGSAASEAPEPPKPTPEEIAEAARIAEEAAAQAKAQASQQESTQDQEQAGSKQEESSKESSEDAKDGEAGSSKKKKDEPPPPPHGDKTPWQVFTDTLRTEFQASKEWNDSTKQLSGNVRDFAESDAVRRAREASEAVSSTTGKVLKGTGKAIGQSAAWTWDTTPVKGLRMGVNATGRGLEKVTRPVRETDAYKSVANVIDDGSSSRYGGWVEKEERRKLREAREAKDILEGRRPPPAAEKAEEDPE